MATVTVKDQFGEICEFKDSTFRTDNTGTNNLEVYADEGGRLFAAYAEGGWVSAVTHG